MQCEAAKHPTLLTEDDNLYKRNWIEWESSQKKKLNYFTTRKTETPLIIFVNSFQINIK